MSFLAPFFLIGLGALLVPVIIHMWSKDAKQSVAFGSLRFLKETETRTTRSIMPSQWLLLVVRLLLLTALVFLLAGMLLDNDSEKSPRMYIVDQFYENSPLLTNLRDTVSQGVEVRWLADGFPDIEEPITETATNYWNLLSSIPTSNTTCVIVISPLNQKHFTGKRKMIPTICQWINPPVEPRQQELAGIEKNGNAYTLTASYDEWKTTVDFDEAESGEAIEITYHLKVDEAHKKLGNILNAALTSILQVSKVSLKEVSEAQQADWILWLSDSPHPEGVSLIQAAEVLNWTSTGYNTYLIPADLSMEDAIKMELPRRLLNTFVGDYFEKEDNSLLTLDTQIFEYVNGETKGAGTSKDASSYVWIALLGLLLLERWLSYKSSIVTA
jgi:hypothetical protein